jgi:predicted MFS family arabinose efflux permease
LEVPSVVSLVQRLTPQRLHGRLMGAVESLDALGLAIGLPLGGALVALSSPRLAYLTIGLGGTAASVVLLRVSLGRSAPVPEGDTNAPPAAHTAELPS